MQLISKSISNTIVYELSCSRPPALTSQMVWYAANVLKAREEKGGAELSRVETFRLRKRLRCDGDRTDQYADSPCVCGPPNLGYAYGRPPSPPF